MQLVNGWAAYLTLENTFEQNFVAWGQDLEALIVGLVNPGTYYIVPVAQLVVPPTVPGAPTGVEAS